MQAVHPTIAFVRNLVLLALLGVAGLVLIGPIVALLSAALAVFMVVGTFAVIGLVFWGLFQVALQGPQAAWRQFRSLGANLASALRPVGRLTVHALQMPVAALRRVAPGIARLPGVAWQTVRGVGRSAGELAFLTVTGTVVGGGVGLFLGLLNHDIDEALPMNAVAGGVLALTAGLVLAVRERRRAATV